MKKIYRQPSVHFNLIPKFLFLVILILNAKIWAQNSDSASKKNSSFGVVGQFVMSTNSVEHGITQTQKDPSLSGEYRFLLGPQLAVGFGGNNASFANEDNHLRLKTDLNMNVDVDADIYFRIKYCYSHFSRETRRDGQQLSLYSHIYGVLVRLQQESNFEGTRQPSYHYAFGYRWPITANFIWTNLLESNDLTGDTLVNYYDFESDIEYKFTQISVGASYIVATEKDQFNHSADGGLLFKIISRF